jgi:hypothetical protein
MTQPMSVPKPGIQDLDEGARGKTAQAPPTPAPQPPSQVGQKGEPSPWRSGKARPAGSIRGAGQRSSVFPSRTSRRSGRKTPLARDARGRATKERGTRARAGSSIPVPSPSTRRDTTGGPTRPR